MSLKSYVSGFILMLDEIANKSWASEIRWHVNVLQTNYSMTVFLVECIIRRLVHIKSKVFIGQGKKMLKISYT